MGYMNKMQIAAAALSGERLGADDVVMISDTGAVTLRHDWTSADRASVALAVMVAAVKAAKVEAILREAPIGIYSAGGTLLDTVTR